MVGDALLDIIFLPEENDGVGMLIGEVNSSLPGNASLAHSSMQKRLMAFYGVLACCMQQCKTFLQRCHPSLTGATQAVQAMPQDVFCMCMVLSHVAHDETTMFAKLQMDFQEQRCKLTS